MKRTDIIIGKEYAYAYGRSNPGENYNSKIVAVSTNDDDTYPVSGWTRSRQRGVRVRFAEDANRESFVVPSRDIICTWEEHLEVRNRRLEVQRSVREAREQRVVRAQAISKALIERGISPTAVYASQYQDSLSVSYEIMEALLDINTDQEA